jgi:hypothetical protein
MAVLISDSQRSPRKLGMGELVVLTGFSFPASSDTAAHVNWRVRARENVLCRMSDTQIVDVAKNCKHDFTRTVRERTRYY